MTTQQLRTAIASWADETLPALNGAYDHAPERHSQAFPTADCVLGKVTRSRNDRRFPNLQIEQADVRVWEVSLVVAVPPDPPDAAEDQLAEFADALDAAIASDPTLGDRVQAADPYAETSFEAFVEFDDGPRARALDMRLVIAESVSP